MTGVEDIRAAVRDGDSAALADAVVIAIEPGPVAAYDSEVAGCHHALRGLDAAGGIGLIHALAARVPTLADPRVFWGLRTLVELIARDSGAAAVDLASARLEFAATAFHAHRVSEPLEWAATLTAADRRPSPAAIGLLRRIQADPRAKRRYRELFADYPDPLLTPGESWADRVTADLAELDDGWTALVRHAGTARSTRPSARWNRTAAGLPAELGSDSVTERLTDWLALVPAERTVALWQSGSGPAFFDDFNAVTVKGLLWTAALLPPDAELTDTIGELVEPATDRTGAGTDIARAAILALARIGDELATTTLRRLARDITEVRMARVLRATLTDL